MIPNKSGEIAAVTEGLTQADHHAVDNGGSAYPHYCVCLRSIVSGDTVRDVFAAVHVMAFQASDAASVARRKGQSEFEAALTTATIRAYRITDAMIAEMRKFDGEGGGA